MTVNLPSDPKLNRRLHRSGGDGHKHVAPHHVDDLLALRGIHRHKRALPDVAQGDGHVERM